jgi:hypothetical protein
MSMHTFVTLENLIVNLANVVAFDLEQNAIRRIWYVGSTTPLELPPPGINFSGLQQLLQQKGFLA